MKTMLKSRLFAAMLALALLAPLGANVRAELIDPLHPPIKPDCPVNGCFKPMSAGRHFSAAGFGRQLGRGLLNVGFFWLEIPYQIKEHLAAAPCDWYEYGFLSVPYHLVAGTVGGTIDGAIRGVTGALEVVLSPIPPHTPLNNPPYPPFMLCFNAPGPVAPPTWCPHLDPPAAPAPPAVK